MLFLFLVELMCIGLNNGFIQNTKRLSFGNGIAFHKGVGLFISKESKYPLSHQYYKEALNRLNSSTIESKKRLWGIGNRKKKSSSDEESIIIIHHRQFPLNITNIFDFDDIDDDEDAYNGNDDENDEDDDDEDDEDAYDEDEEAFNVDTNNKSKEQKKKTFERLIRRFGGDIVGGTGGGVSSARKTSDNFEVITSSSITFKDVGGFDSIKCEMTQCIDILTNWDFYRGFNVRTPKGMILEGPPGNGKTMLAKAFAGEANVSYIAVSGAEFQEKYIGVGSSKIRELFKLAGENKPCIIFIDEIDALGRKRNGDGEAGNAERDNTLNELLIAMDGFKNNSGIFVIGATNRADLLDPALLRAGRIDKKVYVGLPDINTRKAIIKIHIDGKPNDLTVDGNHKLLSDTSGFSGAQIENLLNEAMLVALRNRRRLFNQEDIDDVYNKIIGGWQSQAHIINEDTLERICCHEMGHSIMGLLCKYHPLMKKVVINLNSPRNPGMTIFENEEDGGGRENASGGGILNTREELFERISILYGGRIAEQIIYGSESITSGAMSDYEEARNIAQKMVIDYGMGCVLYGGVSDKTKEKMDIEIEKILNNAYSHTLSVLNLRRDWIISGANVLKKELVLTRDELCIFLL